MKNIIIVESPSKSKTIEGYMGSDYKVLSSVGHIRDLATTGVAGLGIDIENNFEPNYKIISGKTTIVNELKKACKGRKVYLATDPDREGEAISFHLAEVLNLDKNDLNRVVFNEITKDAVKTAFNNPRKLDMDLVSSQETRRMLDRIIGFRVSKLLQSKIGSKSAGRVQSVVLKIIVDLEKEIQAFIPTAYYEFEALFDDYKLELETYFGKKGTIDDKELADKIYNSLSLDFLVIDKESKETKRVSRPAYTTSTMQQDASNKLNFTPTRTMRVAQGLYEGRKIGDSEVGLITYMRTDSTNLSDVFVNETKNFIKIQYSEKYVGKIKVRKQALAQQAHEAIRPTSISRTPDMVKRYLSADEHKLYTLIYNRAIASLMSDAVFDRLKVTFKNEDTTWKITGQTMKFDGFLKVYGKDEEDLNKEIPNFELNHIYKANEIKLLELFTKPKTRYTEATLIKDMEELGIGRPSTYAQTIQTLKERLYIDYDAKKIFPTSQGILTSDKLDEFFNKIINVKYTASMENNLDKISKGEDDKVNELRRFYNEFLPLFENAMENMEAIYPKPTDEICPHCGSMMVIRKSNYGEFIACSNFPKCKYIKQEESQETLESDNITCPVCKTGHIVKKQALKGRNKGNYFYACDNYPKCKTIFNDEPTNEVCSKCGSVMLKKEDGSTYCSVKCDEEKPQTILCPVCKKGHLVKKQALKGRNKGNYFYACDNFPRCKTIFNDEPTQNICSDCGSILLKKDDKLICSNTECNNSK